MEDVIIRVHGEEGVDEFKFRFDYSVLKGFCHRLPERSFFIFGKQFPVCARCLGIYSAFFFGVILFILKIFTFENLTGYSTILISCLLIFPTAIDGFTQLFGLRESNNFLRLTTGLLAGLGFSFMFIFFLKTIF